MKQYNNRFFLTNEEKVIDMHTHTNYSDGELSPNELVHQAVIEGNVGILGITDHDTVEGIQNLDRTNPIIITSGIQIIDGIELTAIPKKGTMHILGYGINIYNEKLNTKIKSLKTANITYILSLLDILEKDYSITFPNSEVISLINAKKNLGRPELAKLCIKYGYVKTVQEAFDKYLKPAYEKLGARKKGIPYEECLELILYSGGIPVLAHPKSLELSDKELLILIKQMMEYGLQGIEAYHSTHTPEEVETLLDIANRNDLLISGGSDYHGKLVKPDIKLGSGKNNNLNIKTLSILNTLNARR